MERKHIDKNIKICHLVFSCHKLQWWLSSQRFSAASFCWLVVKFRPWTSHWERHQTSTAQVQNSLIHTHWKTHISHGLTVHLSECKTDFLPPTSPIGGFLGTYPYHLLTSSKTKVMRQMQQIIYPSKVLYFLIQQIKFNIYIQKFLPLSLTLFYLFLKTFLIAQPCRRNVF